MFTWMQTADIPPIDISDVRISMTIHSINDEYTADILTDTGADSIHIPLKPHDVKNLNLLLQKTIQQVATTFGKGDAYEMALSGLARAGKFAFRSIFPDASTQGIIRDALSSGKIIQIASKDFFVPWELLYDGPVPPDKGASVSHYWGMNHIIWRTIMQDKRRGAHFPSIFKESRPKVGLIASDQLPYVIKQEIPALRQLHFSQSIDLRLLPTLLKANYDEGLVKLGRFLSQEFHIIHLACHAFEQDPIEQSYLFVTKDFSITMMDVVVNNYELKHHPFVILNACLTSVINPLYTSFWAEKFWNMGARGVVATDFEVPDWFAADFSAALYQHLLAGKPIGESLLAMRRHFWNLNQQHNLMGLAYALYASPSIQFVKADGA